MMLILRFFTALVLFPLRAVLYLLLTPLRAPGLGRHAARRVGRVYRRAGVAAKGVMGARDPRFAHPAVY